MKLLWMLAALTVVALALTIQMAATSVTGLPMWAYLPVLGLLCILAAWPLVEGWRPWPSGLRTCRACGTEWFGHEAAHPGCPACGA